MVAERTLLLLRHAQAQEFTPGRSDHERPLTEYGVEQATSVGNAVRSRRIAVDQIICSGAVRTRQTCAALGLAATVDFTDEAYNASSETLLALLQQLDPDVGCALLVGHSPGLPGLAIDLAGPGSDPHAVGSIQAHYPPATLTQFEVDSDWAALRVARLLWLHLAS